MYIITNFDTFFPTQQFKDSLCWRAFISHKKQNSSKAVKLLKNLIVVATLD